MAKGFKAPLAELGGVTSLGGAPPASEFPGAVSEGLPSGAPPAGELPVIPPKAKGLKAPPAELGGVTSLNGAPPASELPGTVSEVAPSGAPPAGELTVAEPEPSPQAEPTGEPAPPSTEGAIPRSPTEFFSIPTMASPGSVGISGASPADRPVRAKSPPSKAAHPSVGLAGRPPIIPVAPELRPPPARAAETTDVVMEPSVEADVAEPSGDAPAGKRRTQKSKPPPADVAASRAVKANGVEVRMPSQAGSSGDAPAMLPKEEIPMEEPGEVEISGAPPATSTDPLPAPTFLDEPEIVVASAPMPRVLPNPIAPTKVNPWLAIHPDHLHLYMHGRLMSMEVGGRATLSLSMTDPDSRGRSSVYIHFGQVSLYNNLYERRHRPEVDSVVSSYFSESLGARFELPGAIVLARDVPVEAEGRLSDEFDR